jgi:tripartite ATP-independent transporter DctP family solute receptor
MMKARSYATKTAIVLIGALLASAGWGEVREQTLRFSHVGAPTHPSVMGAEKWGDLIKEQSGGKITLKIFANGVLGGDVQVRSGVQGGTVDLTAMNSGILQSHAKEFAVFDFPFMFASGEEADPILDGPFGKKMADLLPPKNLVNLAYWELGFREITNSRREIKTLEDLSGIKLRVIQSPIYIDTFAALGCNPVPMPITDVYTAMEQKVIDGHENPFSVIESSKFYEVQKYLTVSNHLYNPQSVLINKKKWDSLSQEERDILSSTLAEATKWQRLNARKLGEDSLVKLSQTMTVSVLPEEELTKIRAKLKPVIEKYAANVGPAVVKELQDALEQQRAKK